MAITVAASIPQILHGEASASRAYEVKAAFVYNFAKFIEWPPEAFADETVPITLCILGHSQLGNALETIKGKPIKGRILEIKYAAKDTSLQACHMLFISASERTHLAEIFASLKVRPVLTIGDMKRFAHTGGMINFFMTNNRIRFEINLDRAEQASLKISSKLLNLATIVKGDG
jgi:hypothetical protein